MKFWLIQRGKWNEKPTEKTLVGWNGRVYLDYMGSAEFEFGTTPKAYKRIMAQFLKYNLFNTGIKHHNGIDDLFVFCNKEQKEEVVKSLKKYIENPYCTKEFVGLVELTKPKKEYDYIPPSFWWWVQNGIDFMAFFGKQKIYFFKQAINEDYNGWWMMKPECEREEEIKDAFNTRY